jgi:hypothetical protein
MVIQGGWLGEWIRDISLIYGYMPRVKIYLLAQKLMGADFAGRVARIKVPH